MPFVRICLAYTLGICLYDLLPGWFLIALVIGILSVSFVLFAPFSVVAHPHRTQWLGLAIIISWIAGGYINALYQNHFVETPDLRLFKKHAVRLIENPVEKNNAYKIEAELLFSTSDSQIYFPHAGILLYIAKDSTASTLQHGDELLFFSQVTKPSTPQNPRQFDYATFLKSKEIYYQSFLKHDSYVRITHAPKRGFMYYVRNMRYAIIDIIREMHFSEKEFGIAAALLSGYKEELDADTKSSFSKVGAMHILAVSGLHVGVIYLMISKVLFFLNRRQWLKMLRLAITLVLLWTYVLITGMSPSVMRAGIMFSFIAIGATQSYQTNIYNTIALSALILLLADPFILYDIGFELSYLAVLGIVFFYPYMKLWVNSRYAAVNYIWSLMAVSIAAQLTTTPISLLHFGQFPISFLLANLLVVPLSGFIIYSGVIAIAVHFIPYLSEASEFVFIWLTRIMHHIILFIETLPYAYATNLEITPFQCLLLFAILLFLSLFLIYRKALHVILTLVCFIVFIATISIRNWQANYQEELIIYAKAKGSYIEVISGHQSFYPSFEELSSKEYGLYVKDYHQWRGIRRLISVQEKQLGRPLFYQMPLLIAGDKKIWILNDSCLFPSFFIHVDYVWVKCKKRPVDWLFKERLRAETFIIDPGLSDYYRNRWIQWCETEQFSYYDIKKSGAFVLPLN